MSDKMHSDPQLLKMYRKVNRVFFNGELSADVMLCWEPVAECDAQTHTVCTPEEEGTEDLMIRIDPAHRGDDRFVMLLLIHEAIHVKLWPNVSHGKAFDAELQRLCALKAYRRLL